MARSRPRRGATKRHDGAGDFPAWIAERRAAPRRTVFIKGNHEDFVWLDAQPSSEVLPALHYLRNGHVHELVAGDEVLRIGSVGGCFGPSNFERHRCGEGFVSESVGLDELLAKTRPRVCFFGHHDTRLDAEVVGAHCLGLNKGHYPGFLVAFEMKPGEHAWRLLGEWPQRGS